MLQLNDISTFLDEYLQAGRTKNEVNGLFRDSQRSIRRIGMLLDPGPETVQWAEVEHLDAIFIHRAAKLETETLPEGVGVLGYHLPFDETLTLGWNLRLCDVLGLTEPEVIGWKQGRPCGMLGTVTSQSVACFYRKTISIFGGREESRTCERNEICRVAVVGGMTDALVREASERDADVYITGQMRQPGRLAMLETGIGVIAVGHKRSEQWGLRTLAHVLHERFAELEVVLPPMGNK
jgi:putative NIF3 family GTP cyclohydrolase 1 type 2